MPKTPLLSLITVNFNDKLGLQRTFDSVFNQTFQDFEYIVIDGGSTDGSKDLIEKNSQKIDHWVSEKDAGIYNAMNKGIEKANGEYLLFLNSGDHLLDENSLKLAGKFVHTEDIIYFNIWVIGQGKDFIKICAEELNFYFFYKDTLPHQATFIKRSAFEKVGLYDESLKIIADWKWFMTAICFLDFTYKKVNETFSIFLLDGISSIDNSSVEKERNLVLSKINQTIYNTGKLIDEQNEKIKELSTFKNKFNHLKKYRFVKLLHKIGLIKIPKF